MGKLCFFCMCILFLFPNIFRTQRLVMALPLYTNSRWIVDESGQRVKLACVNWVSHLETVVAEGLSKQPVDAISKKIGELGFNCVRFTWPLFLATDDTLANIPVSESFQNLDLLESIAGLEANNPSLVNLSLINAYQEVVASLARNNVMVILDNHVSKPGWCCNSDDGSGFFGDTDFDPDLWIQGLTRMATLFNGTGYVIGMSLRNELRGPKQNVDDWYRYMQEGAEAVHSANPNVLVILSGLNYDSDLSFLQQTPISLTFSGKLVYEVHWYGFTDGDAWATGNANRVCGNVVNNVMSRTGFLLDQGYPLFMSEFGMDQRGVNINDDRYMNCLMAVAADLDFDWALWTLVGSYYYREEVIGMEEFYGVLDWNWCAVRNSTYLQRISSIQSPFQGPESSDRSTYNVIFHPSTGLCLHRESLMDPLVLGPCSESEAWSYTPEKKITPEGTYFCLEAAGVGQPAELGIICSGTNSIWAAISDSRMHLSSKLDTGTDVCLDIDSNNTIVTNPCQCLDGDSSCDPGSQWFKLVNSTRNTGTSKSVFHLTSVLDLLGLHFSRN